MAKVTFIGADHYSTNGIVLILGKIMKSRVDFMLVS